LRRVRGGRNKDRGLVLNMIAIAKEDWITYLIIFLCALTGMLFGILIGKIATTLIVLLLVIFLGLTTAGFIMAWSINQKTQVLEISIFQEGLKEQYNAFTLLISELEFNLSVEHGQQVSIQTWQKLQYELAFFPAYIYEELNNTYNRLKELTDLEIIEYRQVIFEELDLPTLISKLRDWQQKIKRQLPYLN
jgi:uncharacterized membrane protein